MELASILEASEWLWKHLKPKKVLLCVEDNADDQMLLREELETVHFKYELVRSGEEALVLLRKTNFNAALIDLGLPQMDGHELARRIRDGYPKVRTFFVTGSSFITLDEGQLIRVIRKPVTAQALRELII